MYIFQTLKIAWGAIRANKVRSVLTTLGIIIGISAVIAMVSIGQGAQASITEQVQGLGSNTISIVPVAGFGASNNQNSFRSLLQNKLDHEIAAKLDNPIRFPEIVGISPELSSAFDISYRSNSKLSTVYGIQEDYFIVTDLVITLGRQITQSDNDKVRKVAVIGPRVKDTLFGESDALDKDIRIDGSNYRVVGITEEKGSSFDDRVFVPLSTAGTILIGNKDYSQISVKVSDEELIDSAAVKIEDLLLDHYRVTDKDKANFTVYTSKDILSLTQSITGIFTALLSSIAGISLVVGGIGIMNIMLVSVSERTKEIGLRKAVGAKQNAILSQFLIEAILLTLIGGIIGIVLGILFGFLAGQLAGFPVVISLEAITLATSVSAGIGVIFGFYPAYRAARLNPIDALRYE